MSSLLSLKELTIDGDCDNHNLANPKCLINLENFPSLEIFNLKISSGFQNFSSNLIKFKRDTLREINITLFQDDESVDFVHIIKEIMKMGVPMFQMEVVMCNQILAFENFEKIIDEAVLKFGKQTDIIMIDGQVVQLETSEDSYVFKYGDDEKKIIQIILWIFILSQISY